MREFISICPKCRQRILCETAQFGKRVACPVCLQEITLPESPFESRATTPASHPAASASRAPAPVGKQGVSSSVVIVGAIVLVVAAGIGVRAVKKARSTTGAPSTTSPSASSHPTLPPTAACSISLSTSKAALLLAARPTTAQRCQAAFLFGTLRELFSNPSQQETISRCPATLRHVYE
jgi:uncharacterized Zn finger protein (UPF0148 family)